MSAEKRKMRRERRKNKILGLSTDWAIQITEWSFDIGWDKEMGGIFYFRDIENKPVLSLEWDMKLLWSHCEALAAFLRS